MEIYNYFACNNVFVRAVSISEHDSRGILHKSHLHAVFCACAVVRLVERPRQVVREGDAVRACAPRPLTPAAALRTASPVVQVELPLVLIQTNYFSESPKNKDFHTLGVFAETLELPHCLEHYRLQAHAATLQKVLLPSRLYKFCVSQ